MKPARTALMAAFLATACPVAATAQSAPTCLTPAEAQAIVSFTLPDLIAGAAQKCADVLGSGSFLAQSGMEMANRYRATADAAWPKARSGIRKFAGDKAGFFDLMPDKTLKSVSAGLATTAVLKRVEPRICGDLDRIMQAVAPLPPENMSLLIGILLEIASRPKAQAAVAKAKSPFNICPGPSGSGQSVTTK